MLPQSQCQVVRVSSRLDLPPFNATYCCFQCTANCNAFSAIYQMQRTYSARLVLSGFRSRDPAPVKTCAQPLLHCLLRLTMLVSLALRPSHT